MKFGEIPVAEARGAIAAHAVKIGGLVLRKGHVISAEDQAALAAAGVEKVVAARLEPGDVGEDAAAEALAEYLTGPGLRREKPFTGRVNLFARVPGLAAAGAVEGARGAIAIVPFRPLRVAVVSTLLPGLKASVVAKTLAVLEGRLRPCGASIASEARVPHETAALADAVLAAARGGDLVVVFGASAITDRRDVIPAAIEAAGGRIEHFGMPVDPGNLLLVGEVLGKPIIGAPGCARSPKENGFDWVLQRLLAGVPIGRKEIQAMGVGGLLMEISTRPQPRTGDD